MFLLIQRLKARKAYHQELQTLHSENHVRLYGKHSVSRKSSSDKKGTNTVLHVYAYIQVKWNIDMILWALVDQCPMDDLNHFCNSQCPTVTGSILGGTLPRPQ